MRLSAGVGSVLLVAACSGGGFSSKAIGAKDRDAALDTGGTRGADGGGGMPAGGNGSGGVASTGGRAAGGSGNGGTGVGGGSGKGGTNGAGGRASGGRSGAGGALGAGGKASGGRFGAGGASTGGASAGGADTVDAGPQPITDCPVAIPDASVACSGTFSCSYGDDPRVSCRSIYACSGGQFVPSIAVKCAPAKNCYADYVAMNKLPVIGQGCDLAGDFCAWDSGLACSCTPCASATCTASGSWSCAPGATSPCPLEPPNEGQACDDTTPSRCTYAGCNIASYVEADCKLGQWAWVFPKCE